MPGREVCTVSDWILENQPNSWRAPIGGMGLKVTPMSVRHLLVPLGLSGPILNSSQTHSYSRQCLHGCFLPLLTHPIPPAAPSLC